jgi:protein SCO1/2
VHANSISKNISPDSAGYLLVEQSMKVPNLIPRARSLLFVGALSAALLVACSAQSRMDYYAKDIACEGLGRDWVMPEASGETVRPEDLKGKVSYVFFGFTACPDVCPTTMLELTQVKHLMGTSAGDLQVVFVTVDLERDTPAVADTYVKAFDGSAKALVGSPAQLEAMAKSFKAFYGRERGASPVGYTMSHTAGGYIFDKSGRLRLFAPYGMPVEQLFSDIQRLQLEPGHVAPGSSPLAACVPKSLNLTLAESL